MGEDGFLRRCGGIFGALRVLSNRQNLKQQRIPIIQRRRSQHPKLRRCSIPHPIWHLNLHHLQARLNLRLRGVVPDIGLWQRNDEITPVGRLRDSAPHREPEEVRNSRRQPRDPQSRGWIGGENGSGSSDVQDLVRRAVVDEDVPTLGGDRRRGRRPQTPIQERVLRPPGDDGDVGPGDALRLGPGAVSHPHVPLRRPGDELGEAPRGEGHRDLAAYRQRRGSELDAVGDELLRSELVSSVEGGEDLTSEEVLRLSVGALDGEVDGAVVPDSHRDGVREGAGPHRRGAVLENSCSSPRYTHAAIIAENHYTYGVKLADVTTPLKPHQQRVVDRIQEDDQPGLVVVHGLGSGKTLSALAAQDALKMRGTFVVPAALQENLRKEQQKHITTPQNITTSSMQGMASKRRVADNPLLVVDEAHRARNIGSETFKTLAKTSPEKTLLLSGSPFYNHPSDIAPLIDLAAHREVLPLDPKAFNQRYIEERPQRQGLLASLMGVDPGTVSTLNPKRRQELQKIFGKWTDYHPGSTEGFPEVTRTDVKVPMTSQQLKIYDTIFKKAPFWVRWKVEHGLPPSKKELETLNSFLSGARQVANTTAQFQTKRPAEQPKIDTAFAHLKKLLDEDPTAKGVVYSNFLDSGINPYRQKLDEAKIPYGVFTGESTAKDRNEMVRQYNDGKLRALLLSSAGGEGLDLKGVSILQKIESYWNQAKGDQVEGRGARYLSHSALPKEKQKMLVENYLSTRPPSGFSERFLGKKPGKSVDEYLTQLSQDKENLIQQFRGLLPQG